MLQVLHHRGPDDEARQQIDGLTLGFVRLSIVGLSNGRQPIWNETGDVVLACNGEVYNHRELRAELEQRGHRFKTDSDCEVVLHLFEEGEDFAQRLNGQFAYAIYDRRTKTLHLGRDQVGIQPMFYARCGDAWVFGSEIKAILEYPGMSRELDLQGLDQMLTFPGLVSPQTMFRGVFSVRPGCSVALTMDGAWERRYWDLEFPLAGQEARLDPGPAADCFLGHFIGAVRSRLRHSEVPVCSYLSGGLDSSLIAAIAAQLIRPQPLVALGIGMRDARRDESRYQKELVSAHRVDYTAIPFGIGETIAEIRRAVRHSEGPLRESYNTASLALSAAVRASGAKVTLSGEGADELFGGYVGYRFDRWFGEQRGLASPAELELRERVFGCSTLRYEKDLTELRDDKMRCYSERIRSNRDAIDCMNRPLIDASKVRGRDPVNQRSYLDFKLRLSDHLLSDHGDRMTMANSVEGRYPFLDMNVIRFAQTLDPILKVNGLEDKFVVRRAASRVLSGTFTKREKFHFTTPTSAQLLRAGASEVWELLSPEHTARVGIFDPRWVGALVERYTTVETDVNFPFEEDWLMTVMTTHLFMDEFGISNI